MKTILMIGLVLILGVSVSAQDSEGYPNTPTANFKYEQMKPDLNDPHPWGTLITKGMAPDALSTPGNAIYPAPLPKPIVYTPSHNPNTKR